MKPATSHQLFALFNTQPITVNAYIFSAKREPYNKRGQYLGQTGYVHRTSWSHEILVTPNCELSFVRFVPDTADTVGQVGTGLTTQSIILDGLDSIKTIRFSKFANQYDKAACGSFNLIMSTQHLEFTFATMD